MLQKYLSFFEYTHRLNAINYFKMKFIKNNLLLIIVDVSASTEASSSVEAETSTIINKGLFFNEFHFEIAVILYYF